MLETTNVKSLDTIFGELFVALIHLKVIRIYIDAVLRFGVPPQFCSAIFKPKLNKDQKILSLLLDRFGDPSKFALTLRAQGLVWLKGGNRRLGGLLPVRAHPTHRP